MTNLSNLHRFVQDDFYKKKFYHIFVINCFKNCKHANKIEIKKDNFFNIKIFIQMFIFGKYADLNLYLDNI